jgi:phosphopantothenoylcysteine decarboxylase/phosphopantothenate--cysteine ligase
MDLDMWAHPSTQGNINRLKSFGNKIIKPGTGELASGLFGEGRMAEPEDILTFLQEKSTENEGFASQPLQGKKALVTAGPTFEAIDPVRFIGNHSSGKMGYALAKSLQKLGAEVTLISGPSSLEIPEYVNYIPVVSAEEMLKACIQEFPSSDITVMSAAVADYRPKNVAEEKIKKSDSHLTVELEKTTDILYTLGSQKVNGQLLIGFALETTNELENAKEKLVKKNLDLIVLNSLQDKGAGFAGDENKITILTQKGEQISFGLKPKTEVAMDICREIVKLIP